MHCVHINIRKVAYILLSLLVNHVNNIYTTGNDMDQPNKSFKKVQTDIVNKNPIPKSADLVLQCPQNQNCKDLNANCLDCDKMDGNCTYGSEVHTECKPKNAVKCIGNENEKFPRSYICRYCYQTNSWEHTCKLKAGCNAIAAPQSIYATNCTVHDHVLCIGNRTFNKNVRCNWTSGYRWTTALALSITLGGFGADRFYLGHWQEGIGKLFSFGGLGVWTLIDVVLISLHYLGPADGSLYI